MSGDGTQPYAGFEGKISLTVAGSEPDWPAYPEAPESAPNIIIVMADDLGFSDLGCYGSEIATPNLDALAASGVKYTNFHVNPMCSPTRASLLTGLNSHAAGVGHVAHSDPGFPGYAMEIAENVATIGETLRDSGWATWMAGKWHLTKDSHLSDVSPKHSWPCQKGFERFYGILDGFTNFHQPHRLYDDNHHVEVDDYPDGYYFTDDITERATTWIRDLRTHQPQKPFFLYFSHGAVHAPLQAKAGDIEKYRGMYDTGWDAVRDERFARMKQLGVIDADTVLPPRNSEELHAVTAWDDLSKMEKEVFARYMEIYAAMVHSVDESFGKLRETLEATGDLDNTIIIFTSDNGGSREGQENGTSQYFRTLLDSISRGADAENVAEDHARMDLLGGPQTLPHYNMGWAMVSSAPFRLYKINTHAGGHQVPMILSWPARFAGLAGEQRGQYQHVTDVLPTLLDLVGVPLMTERNGRPLKPIAGTSFAGTIEALDAPSTHAEQYYEMIGHRGFYRDGWEVVTLHNARTKFGDHEWELYNTATDPTQISDLAGAEPDRLAELAQAFDDAAWANQVYPLDEGTGLKNVRRPPTEAVFTEPVDLSPLTPTLERYRAQKLILSRSFEVVISLDYDTGDEGILFAHGDQGGGYALAVENGTLLFIHNGYGLMTEVPCGPLALGAKQITLSIDAPGQNVWNAKVSVDGHDVGSADGLRLLMAMAPFEGIDVGIDRRSPVSWRLYESHGPFAYTGTLLGARVVPGELAADAGDRWIDVLAEMGVQYE